MGTYATTTDVVRFMGRNQLAIDSNTTFTSSDMDTFIVNAEDQIDTYLNTTWKASKATIQGVDGNGILRDVFFNRLSNSYIDYLASFKVPSGPIQSITKLEIFQGGPGYVDQTSQVSNANRPNGIWYDSVHPGVEVFIGRNIPLTAALFKNVVRIIYVQGNNTTNVPIPNEVKMACYKLAAADLMESEFWSYKLPEGGTAWSPFQVAQNWRSQAFALLDARRSLVWA